MALADDVTAMIRAAPELAYAPGLVLPAAEVGGDPTANAQGVAQGVLGQASDAASAYVNGLSGGNLAAGASYAQGAPPPPPAHHGGGLLSDLGHVASDVGHVAGDVGGAALRALNAPLKYVQHEYRYIHDVEAQHGPLAAVAELTGTAAGAAIGAVIAGPGGVALGGEAATALLGRLTYTDSWSRTSNGDVYRDPSSGQKVSPGRDVASLLGIGDKGLLHGVVSGGIDGAFDLAADPVGRLAGVARDATSAEGAGGLLGSVFSGTRPLVPADVETIYNTYPSVQRAFQDIADASPGEVTARYGRQYGNLASALGAASTPEEVGNVFRQALEARSLAGQVSQTNVLPTLSLTRLAFRGPLEWAAEAPGLGRAARTLRRLPDAFNPDAMGFSSKEFSVADDFGARGIYQTLLMGETPDVAKKVMDEYLSTSDPAQRIIIYRNAVTDMLLARAHMGDEALQDPEVLRNLRARVVELTGGESPGQTAVYGIGPDGRDISRVPQPDGGSISAAITDNQVGKLAFPAYTDIKRLTTELANGKQIFGQADDFLYDHFTQGFFKKLVLLSGSFAAHISLAEAIPNSLRQGLRNIVSSEVEAVAARLGYKAAEDDLGPITGAIYRLMGSPSTIAEAQATQDPEGLSLAAKLTLRHDGQVIPRGVSAGHALAKDIGLPVEEASANTRNMLLGIPPKYRGGDTFGIFGSGAKEYAFGWGGMLRELAGDAKSQLGARAYAEALARGATVDEATAAGAKAITDWLDAQPEEHLRNYVRHVQSSTDGLSPHEDWGRVNMEYIKGATTGADGTIHHSLLDAIADSETAGGVPSVKSLMAIDAASRPAMVKGREFLPDTSGTIDRISNFGHQRVLSPIINFLSRQPIYLSEVKAQYAPLSALVEQGLMTDTEALDLAESRAVNKVMGFVHNVQERTQLSETLRNWVPFYFAQEQSYKRFGRLLLDDPLAFRRMQLMTSALANTSAQVQDRSGVNWAVYPGTGWLTQGTMRALGALGIPVTAALPLAFNGSASSLAPVFPFAEGVRPSVGPLVSIAAHVIQNWDPHFAPAFAAVLGQQATTGPVWEQFVPNTTVQRLLYATPLGEQTRAFQSAMMQQVQALAYEQQVATSRWEAGGEVGPKPSIVPDASADPHTKQKFVDRVRNQTRILYIMKAVLGNVTPASPGFSIGDLGLQSELQADIEAIDPATGQPNGIAVGTSKFLAAHPDATPYTVYQSTSPSGAHLDATAAAMAWVDAHAGFVSRYPAVAAYLIPPDPTGKYDPAVYNEQIALGLRQKRTPSEFLDALYEAAGNQQFYGTDFPAHKAALARVKGDSVATSAEDANWAAYLQSYGLQNPVWYDAFLSKDKQVRAQQALAQLQDAMRAGAVPPGQQADDVAALLEDWATYQQSLVVGRVDGYAAGSKTAARANFDNYLSGLALEKPGLSGLIGNVFRKLA